jgi:hypothetical protein
MCRKDERAKKSQALRMTALWWRLKTFGLGCAKHGKIKKVTGSQDDVFVVSFRKTSQTS